MEPDKTITPAPAAEQPVQPVQPVTPAAPADETLSLDDLFGKEEPITPAPQAPVTPQTPVQPVTPATPAAPVYNPEEVKTMIHEQGNAISANTTKALNRQQELITYFQTEQGKPYQKYIAEISKTALDPRFIGLGIDRVIGLTLTPKTLLAMGAQLGKEAEVQARAGGTGGEGGNASTFDEKKVNIAEMPKDQFEKMKNDALQGKFVTQER